MSPNPQETFSHGTVPHGARNKNINHPEKLSSYFKQEKIPLTIVTISGLIYNIGLTAGPYFEGQLAQKLYDIIQGKAFLSEMVTLALIYVFVILIVQGMRCLKRFYVRRFANDTSRNMRHMLYNKLVHQSKKELDNESVGTLMTKTIADVDACAEGMRKFTTEVFDTGIALIAYVVMMLLYDWRLTLLSCIFTPVAYYIAQKVKVLVYKYNTAYKKSASQLNDATLERIAGAMTYRVFGREEERNNDYEKHLKHYEKAAVMANIWENTLQPFYNIISMTGVVIILYFGGKNVLGTGYQVWDIAAFTAFLSCFTKMALKSSKAAKLFNSVQKAQVSWKRIKPLMQDYKEVDIHTDMNFDESKNLEVKNLSFGYGNESPIFSGLSFTAKPGDIIGITGPVASGKSSLGKAFLCEEPYSGSIKIGENELSSLTDYERNQIISYLGHQPELMSDTIESNICFGDKAEIDNFIKAVCLDQEIAEMPDGRQTEIGSKGVRLSGGQQDRLALARTLYHKKKILVLDDPFSAVDSKTEKEIMENLKHLIPDAILLILSHRITLFPAFSKVIWIENGSATVGTHDEILNKEAHYAKIFEAQQAGGNLDEE